MLARMHVFHMRILFWISHFHSQMTKILDFDDASCVIYSMVEFVILYQNDLVSSRAITFLATVFASICISCVCRSSTTVLRWRLFAWKKIFRVAGKFCFEFNWSKVNFAGESLIHISPPATWIWYEKKKNCGKTFVVHIDHCVNVQETKIKQIRIRDEWNIFYSTVFQCQ